MTDPTSDVERCEKKKRDAARRQAKKRALEGRGARLEKVLLEAGEIVIKVPEWLISEMIANGGLKESEVADHAAVARAIGKKFRKSRHA